MRPRKARFTLKDGMLFSDGQRVDVDPCLVAVCLVADGAPTSGNGTVPEETGARILRLASAVSMVHELENAGLVLDGAAVYVDESDLSPKSDSGQARRGSKDDLPDEKPGEGAWPS